MLSRKKSKQMEGDHIIFSNETESEKSSRRLFTVVVELLLPPHPTRSSACPTNYSHSMGKSNSTTAVSASTQQLATLFKALSLSGKSPKKLQRMKLVMRLHITLTQKESLISSILQK